MPFASQTTIVHAFDIARRCDLSRQLGRGCSSYDPLQASFGYWSHRCAAYCMLAAPIELNDVLSQVHALLKMQCARPNAYTLVFKELEPRCYESHLLRRLL